MRRTVRESHFFANSTPRTSSSFNIPTSLFSAMSTWMSPILANTRAMRYSKTRSSGKRVVWICSNKDLIVLSVRVMNHVLVDGADDEDDDDDDEDDEEEELSLGGISIVMRTRIGGTAIVLKFIEYSHICIVEVHLNALGCTTTQPLAFDGRGSSGTKRMVFSLSL